MRIALQCRCYPLPLLVVTIVIRCCHNRHPLLLLQSLFVAIAVCYGCHLSLSSFITSPFAIRCSSPFVVVLSTSHPSQFCPTSINVRFHSSGPFHPLMYVHCLSSPSTRHIFQIVCTMYIHIRYHIFQIVCTYFSRSYIGF